MFLLFKHSSSKTLYATQFYPWNISKLYFPQLLSGVFNVQWWVWDKKIMAQTKEKTEPQHKHN